ncbi:dephospho-CoA kinase [Candidatus Pacearchaeota archaeon]|nr:MAG: dephospho-CoA kinase [Candidatus Pacearchaeota archaeon]
MKKIGITGGICTGKTTLLNILKNLGFKTFCCDEVVKELYKKSEIKEKLIEIFGKEILTSTYEIDKKKILKKILMDQNLKSQLESLFHPIVKRELFKFFEENKGEKIIFAEVPLLFELNWNSFFDEIWVITCSEKVQKKRILEKFKNFKDIEKLLSMQIPIFEKEKRAHRVFSSEKSIHELEKEVKEILKGYL